MSVDCTFTIIIIMFVWIYITRGQCHLNTYVSPERQKLNLVINFLSLTKSLYDLRTSGKNHCRYFNFVFVLKKKKKVLSGGNVFLNYFLLFVVILISATRDWSRPLHHVLRWKILFKVFSHMWNGSLKGKIDNLHWTHWIFRSLLNKKRNRATQINCRF